MVCLYIVSMKEIKLSSKLNFLKVLIRNCLSTLSKAFSRSKFSIKDFICLLFEYYNVIKAARYDLLIHCLISGFIPGNVGRMDAIVRCGRCLAGGRGCLLKGPHLIASLKFRLPYLINVHQSINPFLLKSRGMKYCPSGKTPTY